MNTSLLTMLHKADTAGLNISNLRLLLAINQDGPLNCTTLSRILHITTAGVTGLIDTLEKRQLIQRVRPTEDRRTYIIHLTQQGEQTIKTITSP
jgi:DNA-binding MarR family transcriptional regulator